jgi:hypothetical protein
MTEETDDEDEAQRQLRVDLMKTEVGHPSEIQPRGDKMTWQPFWLLLPAGAVALVGYGGRGLWADMTADERRIVLQASSLMLGAVLAGASLVVLSVWWAGKL